jgi:3-oxoadipate enol-lactonase
VIDKGTGPPIVLIPGIQGRWEWLSPTVNALAKQHRVLSFSLGELATRDSTGDDPFSAWSDGIERLLDRAGEADTTIVGISFGGLIALRFAARRPARARAVVLASTPPPTWRLDRRRAAYVRHPRLALPLFAWRAGRILMREIFHTRPSWSSRARLVAEYSHRVLRAPVSPTSMAAWVRAWLATDLESDCGLVSAPVLLVTGEAHLDRVVPMEATLQYLKLIDGARHVVLQGTGHVGAITKADRFAEIIGQFLRERVSTPRDYHEELEDHEGVYGS